MTAVYRPARIVVLVVVSAAAGSILSTPALAEKFDLVTIGNELLPVRDMDAAARVPFQEILSTGSGQYTVPTSHRVVIEYVSFTCSAAGSNPPISAIGLATVVGGTYGVHPFTPVKSAYWPDETHYAGSHRTQIYADPGTTVQYYWNGLGGASPSCAVTISGFLAPV